MPRFAIPMLTILASLLTGCGSGPQRTYQEAYEQKLYAESFDKASNVALNEHARDRQRAALVAGLSAQSLGRNMEAKKWLVPLRMSPEKDVAARARAALGLIAKSENNPAEAAALLSGSADDLQGDEAAQAKLFAGDAYRQMGLERQAQTEYQSASKEAADPSLKAMADEKARPKSFFVQCGAFSTRQGAERQAKTITPQVVKARQPMPQVVMLNPHGTPLFVVQVGPYLEKQQALTAKSRIGLQTSAVVSR